jgi:thioredoxin reductase/Pyruvate/2-oxoacid:ferredoxin oxidoreductase delta subunit
MLTAAAFVAPTVLLFAYYLRRSIREERKSVAVRDAAIGAGLVEPPSLHPLIDDAQCIGCGGCVEACPEGKILGLVNGRAQLIEPTHCIGHGACKAACPADAITLVFGSEKRGVDIPFVSPEFETNVPGIFIAGELGGMGLIRNAIEQGRQAMESIRKLDGIGKSSQLDVVIVGAGPSGFSASLAAMQHKLRFVTVEQDSLGGTVSHYPRGKLVMTAPVQLPTFGKVKFKETTKEQLLGFWQEVEKKSGIEVRYGERLEEIARTPTGFSVRTTRETYQTRAVLLAIGRRGTPRKLGVPGEDQEKVVYRLIDPEQYRGRSVLVVGGGDSALEAATSIAEEPGTTVAISYRSDAFGRAKLKNRQKVEQAEAAGRLQVLLKSNVREIGADRVTVEHDGRLIEFPNDAVIVCAGGILPTPFLKTVGIEVETKYGTA